MHSEMIMKLRYISIYKKKRQNRHFIYLACSKKNKKLWNKQIKIKMTTKEESWEAERTYQKSWTDQWWQKYLSSSEKTSLNKQEKQAIQLRCNYHRLSLTNPTFALLTWQKLWPVKDFCPKKKFLPSASWTIVC